MHFHSGYKLQFYVVETDTDGKPVLSQSKPSGLIPSLENARNSLTPTDFLYQTYDAASMPDTVIVQPVVLLGAFKHNFTYSAVLSACRNESEGHEYEEATSEPSAAFKISRLHVAKYLFIYVCDTLQYTALNVTNMILERDMPAMLLAS